MRKLYLATSLVLLFVLLTGCSAKCDKPKVVIGGECCFDGNSNKICDINEVANSGSTVQANTTVPKNVTVPVVENKTTNTTPGEATGAAKVIKLDCSSTKLSVSRPRYVDGGNSTVSGIFSNSGDVNITGIKIQVFNDNGKKIEKSFGMNLTIGRAEGLTFKTGHNHVVDENVSVTMIRFAPVIKDYSNCNYSTIYASDIDVSDKG